MDFIKSYFKLEERGTTLSTEIVAGVTTFLAMAYILPVNSFMLVKTGMPLGGVFLATALAAGIASILMGLLANLPVALAPGMGLNAFFTFTVVFTYGLSWQAALAAVLCSGVLFFIISVTGLRKAVINAIPAGLKFAVGAGIGFFIAFIGLKNAGIVVSNPATIVGLGDFSHPTVLLGVFGILLVFALYAMNNRFALIISIVVTAIVGTLLGLIAPDFFTTSVVDGSGANVDLLLMPAYDNFSFLEMLNGASETIFAAFGGLGDLFSNPEAIVIIFSLLFVDFFDTAGTLMAVGNQAGLVSDEGELIGSEKALLVDSIGTMTGAVLGTSNVTSYIESATGIEQGARTGLTSVVVGLLFILSIIVFPLLSFINGVTYGFDSFGDPLVYSPVTAMALVLVGTLMVGQLKEVDWSDKAIVVPAFLTIIMMMLTFSIATGIAVGFIFYPLVKVAQGKAKEVNVIMYVLAALFIVNFIIGAV